MKKSIFLILFLVSFQLFCFGQEFNDIKISTPRMNGKIVEKVQIALNKCSLLPKKDGIFCFRLFLLNIKRKTIR